MKDVFVYAHGQVIKGLWNVKAGLVSFVWGGQLEYVGAECIVPSLLARQAW